MSSEFFFSLNRVPNTLISRPPSNPLPTVKWKAFWATPKTWWYLPISSLILTPVSSMPMLALHWRITSSRLCLGTITSVVTPTVCLTWRHTWTTQNKQVCHLKNESRNFCVHLVIAYFVCSLWLLLSLVIIISLEPNTVSGHCLTKKNSFYVNSRTTSQTTGIQEV